jgi:CTP synthase
VDEECVFEVIDAETTIYEVPLMFAKSGLAEVVLKKLDMEPAPLVFDTWRNFVNRIKNPKGEVRIALVGKYAKFRDSYKSIFEAFVHAGSINNVRVIADLVNSEDIDDTTAADIISKYDGVLVGPGFGNRGIEGKIASIRYCRENNVPFFGICLGMQCAVIEFSRNVCGLADANSYEFSKTTPNKVIDLMEEQKTIKEKGGTMRLGAYPCVLKEKTIAFSAYKSVNISERHRHRYEVNNKYRDMLEQNGMILSGLSPDGNLVEMMELPNHPWFVGCQFHPELKSRAVTGHPLFASFIKAVLKLKKEKSELL